MTSPTVKFNAAGAAYFVTALPSSGGTAPAAGDRVLYFIAADDGLTGWASGHAPAVGSFIRTPVAPAGFDYYAVWDTGILDASGATSMLGASPELAATDNPIFTAVIVSGSTGAAVAAPSAGGGGSTAASNPSWSGPSMTSPDSLVIAALRSAGAGSAGASPFTFPGGWTSLGDQKSAEGDNQWLTVFSNVASLASTISVTCAQASNFIALGLESLVPSGAAARSKAKVYNRAALNRASTF